MHTLNKRSECSEMDVFKAQEKVCVALLGDGFLLMASGSSSPLNLKEMKKH